MFRFCIKVGFSFGELGGGVSFVCFVLRCGDMILGKDVEVWFISLDSFGMDFLEYIVWCSFSLVGISEIWFFRSCDRVEIRSFSEFFELFS